MANDKVKSATLKNARAIAKTLKSKYPDDESIVELKDIIDSEMQKRNGTQQKRNKDKTT